MIKIETETNKKIIVAVSGGADSVCLLHLILQNKNVIAVAHCNFQLRGLESDEDEIFVKELCLKLNIPFYIKKFNTAKYAAEKNLSIQEAARELRYKWFEELRKELKYDLVASAHHANDQIETVLHHIIRGCGIEGLKGMQLQAGKLIRPLLNYRKHEIIEYLYANKLSFREDSSNLKTDYTRNNIRHEIIPALQKINPAFENTFLHNIMLWQNGNIIYNEAIQKVKKKWLIYDKQNIKISIGHILSADAAITKLFECINKFGFNGSQCHDIFLSLKTQPGKNFITSTHRLIIDRKYIIVTSLINNSSVQMIESDTKTISTNYYSVSFERIKNNKEINLSNKKYLFLDISKLDFPLMTRAWKQGDYFYPQGLNKKKKVSDYFTDKKLSLIEKERTLLLLSGEKIAAIMPDRMDERFKVTDATTDILKIEVIKK